MLDLGHVMRGHLGNVWNLLTANKALVYAQGDITDISKRKFSKITAFQYALWALDKPMWELILKFLPKGHAANQCKALEQDRKDITRAHGTHFSFDPILEKLQHYIDHYDGWNRDQRGNYWCKKVGGAQLAFPAWLIMMMCEKGYDTAWTKQDVNRPVVRDFSYLTRWVELLSMGAVGGLARGTGGAELRRRDTVSGVSTLGLPTNFQRY